MWFSHCVVYYYLCFLLPFNLASCINSLNKYMCDHIARNAQICYIFLMTFVFSSHYPNLSKRLVVLNSKVIFRTYIYIYVCMLRNYPKILRFVSDLKAIAIDSLKCTGYTAIKCFPSFLSVHSSSQDIVGRNLQHLVLLSAKPISSHF